MRFYTVGDRKLPSVTTILGALPEGEGLAAWRERVGKAEADRILRESASIGHLVHYRLSSWAAQRIGCPLPLLELDGRVPARAAEVVPFMWATAERLLSEHRVEPILTESVVANPTLGYAGRIDLYARVGGEERQIVDLKTSRTTLGIDKWEGQCSAYAHADRPTGAKEWPPSTTVGSVLWAPGTGEGDFIPLDLDRGWVLFQEALKLWREQHP